MVDVEHLRQKTINDLRALKAAEIAARRIGRLAGLRDLGDDRFIGQSTWMSQMGSRPNRLGIRVFTNSMMRDTAV